MKKKITSAIAVLLIVCMMVSAIHITASAATEHFTCVQSGTQTTVKDNLSSPLSAWKTTSGKYGSAAYTIQLQEMYTGAEAQNIVKYENQFNSDASSTQQWILMKFTIKNNSASVLGANHIIQGSQDYYTKAGSEIEIYDTAAFSRGTRLGIDTDIAAGQQAVIWHGILIDKTAGYPVIAIPHTDLIYYSFIDTTPTETSTPAPTPTPVAPNKLQVYRELCDYLGTYHGHAFTSDVSEGDITLRITIDSKSVADSIFISYYIQQGLVNATLNIKINSSLNGVYPVTLYANYDDVGQKGSLVTTLTETCEGPYNITSLIANDDFHRNDLKETLPIAVQHTMLTLATVLNSGVNENYSLSSLGFSKNFLCPSGHTVDAYTYNNDATATKDGTKSGACSVCYENVTISALGTKTAATPIKDSSKVFKDVESGRWYKNAIDYSYSNGFISGVDADRFALDTYVTRGMFVTILARIAGIDTTTAANQNVKTKFTDVASGRFFSNAVKWAYEHGVVSGTSDTTFSPDSNITREQLCVMIANFAKAYGVNIAAKNAAITFADSSDIATWSSSAVATCQKAGIVSGYVEGGKTYFKPKKTATRAEAAQILYKFHSEFVIA